MSSLPLPRNLVAAAEFDSDGRRRGWLTTLSTSVNLVERHWRLQVGEPFQPGGQIAWVAPARTDSRDDLVLKLSWQNDEELDEANGLRAWDGQGAVRLYAAETFGDTSALLLERCTPGTPLASRPEPEQDIVIASLLSRLWLEPQPGHPFRPLQDMCDAWADEFERNAAAQPGSFDPSLTREGVRLLRSLPSTAERQVLLCTDLHAHNVLAATRESWLMIDPKPYVGDPTYDPVQHLLNCDERLRANPLDLIRRMADLLHLEADRLALWTFARCAQESLNSPELAEVARRIAPT
ncbi:MAG: aminoglycoside phosphotransferase family protein [Candidatus Dormiibacterota bacterium]